MFSIPRKSFLTGIVITLFLIDSVFAQAPDTSWTKAIGGADNDIGYSVQQTSDGGYIIAGYTWSYGAGGYDVYLIKTDANGNVVWTKTFGGTNDDFGRAVQQTSDGGYIIAGYTYSFGAGLSDVYLIKTDADGNLLWQKTYGGTNYDFGYSVQQTSDGGYIITGSYNSNQNIYLIKTDANGDTLWTRTYSGTEGRDVKQTSDGKYIIAGTFYGSNFYDVYLLKIDGNGTLLWSKSFGGSGDDRGNSVAQTSDGGYIIAGYTNSYGAGSYDIYLIKTDSIGDTLWTKTYGGSGNDLGYGVDITDDGSYITLGSTNSFGAGDFDIYVIKVNSNGDTLWTKTIGGINGEGGYEIGQVSDKGYVIVGYTSSYGAGANDVYLIKLKAELLGEEDLRPSDERKEHTLPSLFTNVSFFKNTLSIKFSQFYSTRMKIVLYNASGVSVFRKDYPCVPLSLYIKDKKIGELSSGIYFLSVLLMEPQFSEKIIKKQFIKLIKP